MSKEPLIHFIQTNMSVTSDTVEHIVSHFDERKLAKNDLFLKEGKRSNELFFLVDGFMRAFTYDPDGNEVTTSFYSANSIVVEVSSFYKRVVSLETIQAMTACQGFSITLEKVNLLFHSVPQFRELARASLVEGFSEFKQRTLSLINKNAEQRYADLVANHKAIAQYAQLKHIASYLGITDSTLSRIRHEYAKKN